MIYNILTNKKRSIFRVDMDCGKWSKSFVDSVHSDTHTAFNQILIDYLNATLWTEVDRHEIALDLNYDVEDIDHDTVIKLANEIERFIREAMPYIFDIPVEMIGHDICLSRNGHGAGFFDRGYKHGDELQAIAEKMGESNVYVGDDRRIYSD